MKEKVELTDKMVKVAVEVFMERTAYMAPEVIHNQTVLEDIFEEALDAALTAYEEEEN